MRLPAQALVGLALWAASGLWLRPSLLVFLLLFGPFVVVPLVLGLLAPPRLGAGWGKTWNALRWLQVPAALAIVPAFRAEAGLVAAAWTVPWLGFAGLVALSALVRFLTHRMRPFAEVAIDAGLAFLFVGAIWLTVSRSGEVVLGFGDPIALLTAAHFNLAGIAVPVLAGLAARRLPGRLASLTAFGAISGLPVVAAGIILQAEGVRYVNTLAVAYFVVAMVVLSVLNAKLALNESGGWPKPLWAISAAALPVGMALAMVYASSEVTGFAISIETMARTHAVINIFGFTVPALLAWWFALPAPAIPPVTGGAAARAPA